MEYKFAVAAAGGTIWEKFISDEKCFMVGETVKLSSGQYGMVRKTFETAEQMEEFWQKLQHQMKPQKV